MRVGVPVVGQAGPKAPTHGPPTLRVQPCRGHKKTALTAVCPPTKPGRQSCIAEFAATGEPYSWGSGGVNLAAYLGQFDSSLVRAWEIALRGKWVKRTCELVFEIRRAGKKTGAAAFRHHSSRVVSCVPMDGILLIMSKSETKKYKDLNLNFDSIAPCIVRHGGVDPVIEKKNDREHHLRFHVKDNVFLMKIFPVAGGVFSLGKAAGHCPDTFAFFADKVLEECVTPTPAILNVSLPKFPAEHVASILGFLIESGAEVSEVDGGASCKMYRVVGKLGDSLVIKHFKIGTLQLQGKYRNLASSICDYLGSVLSLDEVIKSQAQIYAVDLTVEQVKDGLQAVLPVAHGFISEAVRIQLSSAFTLTKINLPVEDYSCVAFPALRGLEGFIKDLLVMGNFRPAPRSTFSDYFRDGRLGVDQASHVGERLTEIINICYKYYHAQRHRSFHMDAPSDTSRILDFVSAKEIVATVFDHIEASCKRLAK